MPLHIGIIDADKWLVIHVQTKALVGQSSNRKDALELKKTFNNANELELAENKLYVSPEIKFLKEQISNATDINIIADIAMAAQYCNYAKMMPGGYKGKVGHKLLDLWFSRIKRNAEEQEERILSKLKGNTNRQRPYEDNLLNTILLNLEFRELLFSDK